MKVTVERVHDDVHDVGSSVQDLKIGQAEVQDRLNAMYVMLCGGTESFSLNRALRILSNSTQFIVILLGRLRIPQAQVPRTQ